MNIIAFNGSPKGKDSVTWVMVEEFLTGARAAGAQAEHVVLADKNIKYCKGCFACWLKTPGRCVLQDDMAELGAMIRGKDIVVFASPLYVDNITALLKNFLDRSVFLGLPFFETDANGETVHKKPETPYGKIVVMSNCGFPEQTHFQVISHYFKRVARNFHTEVIAEIFRGEGPLLRVNHIFLAPVIAGYKKWLHKAGKEVAESLKLSDDTKAKLEQPLIPYAQYREMVNARWAKELAHLDPTA